MGETGYCILMEEIGRVCTSTATLIGAHIGIGTMAIYMGGTEAQKTRYMPDLCSGRKIAAFCLTEPGAGSDAAGHPHACHPRRRQLDHHRLQDLHHQRPDRQHLQRDGHDRSALGARGGVTAFIVERDMPGLSVGTIEHKMGIRGSATSEMVFDEVCVPGGQCDGPGGRRLCHLHADAG